MNNVGSKFIYFETYIFKKLQSKSKLQPGVEDKT